MSQPSSASAHGALLVERHGFVRRVFLNNPPNNFIDADTLTQLADLLEEFDRDQSCRSIVLTSIGKHFCAGANLAARLKSDQPRAHIYDNAPRLAQTRKPIVASITGAAIGAGLGLAMLADFRVGTADSRFSANFCMQGYHPGFGLTVTLPRVIGKQHAQWMLLTGCRIKGGEAHSMGLIDRLAEDADSAHSVALQMASELAAAAPLAVQATRKTLQGNFAKLFSEAIKAEKAEQDLLLDTEDYREGVMAMNERRLPNFVNR